MIRWRILARLRTVVLLGVAALGLAGLAMTGTAGAQPPSPIKHIVVLYLENHSFDSLLGFWCDQHPGRCPDGGMPGSVRLSNGAVVTPSGEPDIVPIVDHSVAAQNAAIDGGRMDGWENVNGCDPSTNYACVGGWTPSQQPNLTNLADNFAISDNTFSMANSPSWGGHLYAVLGNLDGFMGDNPIPVGEAHQGPGWGCDSNKETTWVSPSGGAQLVPSCIPDPAVGRGNGGAFEATPASYEQTLMDSLTAAHLSWAIYGAPVAKTQNGAVTPGYYWDICPSIAECLYTGQKANNLASSSFVSQAKAGNLPSFSIVIPGAADAAFSEHNGMSMTAGDDWLGQVANAVMAGPEWRSTVLFITWDDCGCFYDQVPPGTNPDGTPQGPRVPLVIVSPYTKPGYTDTTATTFSGILAFVENTYGLNPLGRNDAQAYDFSNAFNFGGGGGNGQALLKPVRMVYRPWPKDAYHISQAQLRQDT